MLGLGSSLVKGGLATPGIVTDSLVLKHNYAGGSVVPVSDGAIYFDASADSYVTAVGSPSLDFTDAFSSCFWIKTVQGGSTQDWDSLWGKGDLVAGVQVYSLKFTNSDVIRLELNEDSGSRADSTSTFTSATDGIWFHVACTYDKSNTKMYINGVLEDTTSYSTSISTNSELLHIGMASNTGNGFKGYMCNLGMWNVALTQAQIKSIMNKKYTGLTSGESEGLVSWWGFDADANDATGTNNGTISGG